MVVVWPEAKKDCKQTALLLGFCTAETMGLGVRLKPWADSTVDG